MTNTMIITKGKESKAAKKVFEKAFIGALKANDMDTVKEMFDSASNSQRCFKLAVAMGNKDAVKYMFSKHVRITKTIMITAIRNCSSEIITLFGEKGAVLTNDVFRAVFPESVATTKTLDQSYGVHFKTVRC